MKQGLLLINIGTPSSPKPYAIRRYLHEFLSDKRVVALPFILRFALLYGFILPFRPKRTAKAYQAIWTEKGSPLLWESENFVHALQAKLGSSYQVALGMRYGKPSIQEALNNLAVCQKLTILPLFPQYASATTGSALEKTLTILAKQAVIPALTVLGEFYQHPGFLQAMTAQIKPYAEQTEYILFSYHGLPVNHLSKARCPSLCTAACEPINPHNASCYRAQCYQTTRLLADILNLSPARHATAFQSRLGKTAWIEPFTEQTLLQLAQQGIKNITVVCPSFVTDCLETLEEIGIRAKELWIHAGGETLTLVPCLNSEPLWIEALESMLAQKDGQGL